MGLFLGPLFFSIHLPVYSFTNTVTLYYISESGKSLNLCLFFNILLDILDHWSPYVNFRLTLLIPTK